MFLMSDDDDVLLLLLSILRFCRLVQVSVTFCRSKVRGSADLLLHVYRSSESGSFLLPDLQRRTLMSDGTTFQNNLTKHNPALQPSEAQTGLGFWF